MTPQNISIAGAGIMGLSAACALARAGHAVTLYDPAGIPAPGASWVAGGMLAPYSEIEHMDMDWVKAGFEGIQLWREFLQTTNRPVDFAQNGSLLIAHAEDKYALDRFKSHLPTDQLNLCQTKQLEPALAGRFNHGLYLEGEAHIHPQEAMEALLAAFEAAGGTAKEQWAEMDDLAAQYDVVIDCRGMGAAGDDPDLRGVKGETLIVRNPEFSLQRPVRLMHPRYPLYIVPRPGDIFMIGATQIESDGENERVSLRSAMELMSALYSLDKSFGEAQIIEISSGIRPSYPDNLPRIRKNNNVISANGLFRHGYLLAPLMAECIAKMVEGERHSAMSLFYEDKNQRKPEKPARAA